MQTYIRVGVVQWEAKAFDHFDDFLKVEGFQQKMAKKVYEGIQDKLEKVSLVTFMAASNVFGRGFSDKKLELILDSFPDILISTLSNQEKIHLVKNCKGMAEKTAEAFVIKIPAFIEFGKDCGLNHFIYSESKQVIDAMQQQDRCQFFFNIYI
jgi:hypothetical protein